MAGFGTPDAADAYDVEAVAALSATAIPWTTKGFGGLGTGGATTALDLVVRGASVFDGTFTFPLLTVREPAVRHNVEQLARYCSDTGVLLAPHAKTTMAPQLFARQLDAGAWGLTVATVGQAQLCRAFGAHRLLLANELVDGAAIAWVAAELAADPGFELFCYVDSLAGVRLLDAKLRANATSPSDLVPRRLPVLVELGHLGGRTGCRTTEEALAVARAATATTTLSLAGVAGYEGGIGPDRSAASLAAIEAFCERLVDAADLLATENLLPGRPVITAGGSAYPDVVAEVLGRANDRADVVLRSGCYVTHDDGEYARISPFRAGAAGPYTLTSALLLWTQVLSRPEPGMALLGAGRRDVGFDQGFPVPLVHRTRAGRREPLDPVAAAWRVTALNDQHAYLTLPAGAALEVGDFVGLGVSHPCTTLDRWTHVVQTGAADAGDAGAEAAEDTVTDVVHTFF